MSISGKKIFIFIDHNIIIRHFIFNNSFSELEKRYEIKYIFSDNKKRITADIRTLGKTNISTIPFDQARSTLYRKLYRTTIMKMVRSNPAYKTTKDVWLSIVGRREIWKRSFLSLPIIYEMYRAIVLTRLGENKFIQTLIETEKPDLIIHPTVLEGDFVSDVISLGKKSGTKTVYLMNSWDNASTKAMMIGSPDWLIVWGKQTKKHAVEFLGIPSERIVSLGAAQFDVYSEVPDILPAEFKGSINISPETKIILYAGSSNGFDEIEQLKLLNNAINAGPLNGCHVLYRPHPWRGTRMNEKDFFQCGFKHVTMDPYMVDCYKKSRKSEKPSIYFQADYKHTNIVLKASNIVISGISSMMLESVLLGKPVVCSTFDKHIVEHPILSKVAKMYHFNEFFEITCITRTKHQKNFISDCKSALEKGDSASFTEDLKKRGEYFVTQKKQPFKILLSNFVDSILQ